MQIHVPSIICDVISFNGQGQLCLLNCVEIFQTIQESEHDSVKPAKCSEKEKNKQGNKRERTGKERKGKEKEESLLLSVHVRTLQANNNYSVK